MDTLRRSGMFFWEGERKFFVRGVSYGPFRPQASGDPFPEKSVTERDFARIRSLGANTLRVYHVPPPWLCELAGQFGLRMLVGVPWPQHLRFLDSGSLRTEIREQVRRAALALRDVPNLLGLLLGNEISPQIVRWYGRRRIERFLGELASEARACHPELLLSYASFPMTEYLDPPDLDFVSFNVYLHRDEDLRRYLARLQNLASFRPVVLTEFGMDSMREGEEAQAALLERTIRTAAEAGCAGSVAFSYTDEWHTGGHDIEDWAFGLVTRDRRPKAAYSAVQRAFAAELPEPSERAPKVSVVICAYNAERTMEECLESLTRIEYPDYEVIVVDDGSTDGTLAIARRYPKFRVITHENRGLSAARNDGILAANGDIIAFTDSDCAADPHWLTFLVRALLAEPVAGVGGPNLPPPEAHWIPEVVARSPGGPTHVLLSDREAEHVPGCNMAFWKKPLLEIGGFDPIFRAAGDDVDICWRLQDAGHRIGFAPAALVWHRRRATVRAYLKQQKGYGQAEGLLYFRHPYRFNALGQSRWVGRIYGGALSSALGPRAVIYGGVLGSGLFQTLYAAPTSLLHCLPSTFEWNAAALGLVGMGAAGWAAGASVPVLTLMGVGLLTVSAAHAIATAWSVDVRGVPVRPWRARALIAALNYLGPLLRAIERYRAHHRGLHPAEPIPDPVLKQVPELDARSGRLVLPYWSAAGIEKEAFVYALLDYLRTRKVPILLDDGWRTWDLAVQRGLWVRARVLVLVQDHGSRRRQVDVGIQTRPSRVAAVTLAAMAGGVLVSVSAGSTPISVAAMLAGTSVALYVARQALQLSRALYHAVEHTARALDLTPIRAVAVDTGASEPSAGALGRRALLVQRLLAP